MEIQIYGQRSLRRCQLLEVTTVCQVTQGQTGQWLRIKDMVGGEMKTKRGW